MSEQTCKRFVGRWAIITGAAQGIGLAAGQGGCQPGNCRQGGGAGPQNCCGITGSGNNYRGKSFLLAAALELPGGNSVHVDSDDELAMTSNILLYRNRCQDEEAWFVAGRRDRLRRMEGQWLLARRHILLDQHVTLDENLSVFL